MRTRICLLAVLCFVSAQRLSAQYPGTGVYAFGSFDNKGFDSINLGNLNVHFQIPVVSKQGRGLNFKYALAYDGLVWASTTSAGTGYWQPDGNWGFYGQLGEAIKGYISFDQSMKKCFADPPSWFWTVVDKNYQYHDQFGVSHLLNYSYDDCTSQTSGDGSTSDGSGIRFDNVYIHLRNGTTVTPSYNSPGSSGAITDTNGNTITDNGNGTFTDTTGTTELTIAGGGNASSPLTFTYPVLVGGVSTTATATVYYQSYTVQTNFGCSGISEYSATSISLVDHITLADSPSDTYTFTYEPTPGVSGAVTGRLASVTLPTGGTISYTYSGGCSGGINTDGTPATLVRSTSAGQKTYTRTITGAPTYTTQVLDEEGNEADFQFINDTNGNTFETSRSVYQGSAATGSQLESKTTDYWNVSSGVIQAPIYEIRSQDSYNGIRPKGTDTTYQANGLPTFSSVYDPTTEATLVSTTTSYNSLGKPTSVQTTDPTSNTTVSSVTYGYDETTPTGTSGIPQHTSVSGTRGNQTSAHISTGSGTLDSSVTYYDTGVPVSATAPGGFTTTYGYDSTQTFDTQTTLPAPSSGVQLASSANYDTSSGVQISFTDANNQQTSNLYDRLSRPTQVSTPDGGQTTYTYTPTQVSVITKMSSTQSADQETFFDDYGRTKRVAVANGTGWYLSDYCYDEVGLLQYQSFPYYSSTENPSSLACSSSVAKQYSYDALGRKTRTINPDGTSVTIAYNGRAVKVTDPLGVSRIRQYDLLGRLSSVCEISTNNLPGSDSPQNCGMDVGGTGYVTSYAYNLSAHTTTVTQGMQGTQAIQTRIFKTDLAGRSTSVIEPESGTTTYGYSYNSTGLVVTRTRPQANQTSAQVTTTTTYQYDALGRILSVTYSDGTPTKTYAYDTNSWQWTNFSPSNLKGRLYLAYNASAPAATVYSYDPMGRISGLGECLPSGCGNGAYDKHLSFSYDLAGNLTSKSDPATGTISFTRSLAGEMTSAVNQSYNLTGGTGPTTLVSSVQSGPFGPTSWLYGNGLSFARYYNGMGQVYSQYVCSGSNPAACSDSYNLYGFDLSWTGSYLTGMTDGVVGQRATMTYDEFGRLSAYNVNLGSPGSYSYTYDRWGNRLQQTVTSGSGPSPSYTIYTNPNNTNANQIAQFSYDAAGNMMNDGVHSYTYDADGNLTAVDGGSTGQYKYDALNHKVRWQVPGGAEEVVFDPAGRSTSLWGSPSGWTEGHIFADGQQIAFRGADNHTYFVHRDWINTDRLHTDPNGNVVATWKSLPFGDNGVMTPGGGIPTNDFDRFGDMDLNGESNTYQAQFRQYNPTAGRWMSPDPYTGSYSFGNPQSLNRYTYVANQPLSANDPSGHMMNLTGDPAGWGDLDMEQQQCAVDGDNVDCGLANDLEHAGAAVQCPNNICNGWDQNGVFGEFFAFAGGAQGYYNPLDLSQGINIVNGHVLDNYNYNNYLTITYADAVAAQYARTVSNLYLLFGDAASADPSDPQIRGAHANFTLTCSDLSVCGVGRYPFGIHIEPDPSNPTQLDVHDDTVSPWTTNPPAFNLANFLEHGFVDLFGGTVCNCVFSH